MRCLNYPAITSHTGNYEAALYCRILKGKQSQCLEHMGLTELIKSNNFQQQSYF